MLPNVDVAVAVAIEGGLITPIVRNTNNLSIVEISSEIKVTLIIIIIKLDVLLYFRV